MIIFAEKSQLQTSFKQIVLMLIFEYKT